MNALTFKSKTFDVVDNNGQSWLTLSDIAEVLYRKDSGARADQIEPAFHKGGDQSGPSFVNEIRQVQKLYQRHADEFTDKMTALVEMATAGGKQMVRIFSLRGAHLLAMFARSPVAKEFRVWILDLLERETSLPFTMNPGDVLTLDQADLLRDAMTAHCTRLPKAQQGSFMISGWSKLKSHFKVSYRKIPQAQLTEALSLIMRHATEWMPADDVGMEGAPTPQMSREQLLQEALSKGSWLLRADNGRITLDPIPVEAFVATSGKLPALLGEERVPVSDLPKIIEAATARLNSWACGQFGDAQRSLLLLPAEPSKQQREG